MSLIVLVTGASSGIGKAIANYLADHNYTVYGTSRNPKPASDIRFNLLALDVLNPDSIEQAVAAIISKETKIDVLVNNAGMGITGPIEDTPTEEMRNVFNTNFFGAIDVMKAVMPHMRAQRFGYIINVTSIAGYMGLPFRGVYSATKGALGLVSESIRMEAKEFGVQVVTVAPGDFATNIAAGRYHTPVFEDSAYAQKYGENLALMNAHVDHGMDPQVMAKKVYAILQKKHPKTHYKVGAFMEKFSIVLKRILPHKMYEKLLMNHYKL